MNVKKVSVIILIMLVFLLSSCSSSKAESDSAEESTQDMAMESIWVREDGLTLKLNEDDMYYSIMTSSDQVGYGKYVKNEEGYFMEYGDYWYEVKFRKNGTIKLITKDGSKNGILSESVLERDDTAEMSMYAFTELQGAWENPNGTLLEFDTQSKQCTLISEDNDVDLTTDIIDDFNGMGNYIVLDDTPVYIKLTEKGVSCGIEGSFDKLGLGFLQDDFRRISYNLEDE